MIILYDLSVYIYQWYDVIWIIIDMRSDTNLINLDLSETGVYLDIPPTSGRESISGILGDGRDQWYQEFLWGFFCDTKFYRDEGLWVLNFYGNLWEN